MAEYTSKAGGVINWTILFPRGRVSDRDGRMCVVDAVRSDESAHAAVEFCLLDREYGRGFWVFSIVLFGNKFGRWRVEGYFDAGGESLDDVFGSTSAPVEIQRIDSS